MDYYPDNNAAHYYTKLPEMIDLSGIEYEIGLAEIQFSSAFSNLKEHECSFKIQLNPQEGEKQFWVPKGLYIDTASLINAINHIINKEYEHQKKKHLKMKDPMKFYFDPVSRKVLLKLYNKHHKLEMNHVLADLLNMDTLYEKPGRYYAYRFISVYKHNSAMYVYCDLVRHRSVGNVMVPLLRVIPLLDPSKNTVHVIYEQPHYIPISRHNFDTIEILLSTDAGESGSFIEGETIITLHIRPRKHV